MGEARPPRNFDHVEPKEVADLLREEQQLLSALGKRKEAITEARKARDDQVQKEKPKHEKQLEAIERKIEATEQKKEKAYQQMSSGGTASAREIHERQRLMDHLKIAQLDLVPVGRELDKLVHQAKQSAIRERGIQKELERLKPPFKSQAEAERLTKDLERKIERAKERDHTDVLKVLMAEKGKLEQGKDRMEIYQSKMKELQAEREKAKELSARVKSKEVEHVALKAKVAEFEERKEALPKPPAQGEADKRKAMRDEQYQKVQEVKKELDKLHEQKRDVLQARSSAQVRELDGKVGELIDGRKEESTRLDEVRRLIPSHTVKIADPDTVGALVGKGGATLQELQSDYGVMIDIRRGGPDGETVVVRGGQCEECGEAITEILREAALSKHKEFIDFDPLLTREFIGAGGQHIQRLQTQSGASINLLKDEKGKTMDGKVVVVGKKENVEGALDLIKQFKEDHVRETLEYSADMAGVIRVPLLKQWQEEYNCRSIRSDQDSRIITLMGKAADVAHAKAEIDAWIKESRASKCEIRLGTVPPQVIIGRGGENVRLMQSETKTQISIQAGRVSIVGGKEAVAKAKQMVEQLIQENIREEYKVDYKQDMFNFLVRPRPWEIPVEGEEDRAPACLLEQIKVNCGCDQVRALREQNKVLIKGKQAQAQRARDRLRRALEFTGQTRLTFTLEPIVLKHFTQRSGGRSIVDEWRDGAGIVEVMTSGPREPTPKVELIGEEAAVQALKTKIEERAKGMEAGLLRVDVESGRLGGIVGPGGATIRRIQEEFECALHIDNAASQVVVLAEDEEKALKAKAEVERVASSGGDTRFSGN